MKAFKIIAALFMGVCAASLVAAPPMKERHAAYMNAKKLREEITTLQQEDSQGNAAKIDDLQRQFKDEQYFAKYGRPAPVEQSSVQPTDDGVTMTRLDSNRFNKSSYSADDSEYWKNRDLNSEEFASVPQAQKAVKTHRKSVKAAERQRQEAEKQEREYNSSLKGKARRLGAYAREKSSQAYEGTKAGISRAYQGTKSGLSRAYEGTAGYAGSARDWTGAQYNSAKEQCSAFYNLNWQEKQALCAANPGKTALAGVAAAGVVGLTVYAAYRAATGLYNWFKTPRQLPTPPISSESNQLRDDAANSASQSFDSYLDMNS